MVLIVEEISRYDFVCLSSSHDNYLKNGVIFSCDFDDVIAFEKVNFEHGNSISYWKVIEKK